MPNTKDLIVGNAVQVLAYGKPKTGKTFGALTFPRPNVIDFDRGIVTAKNPAFVAKYGLRDILYQEFFDSDLTNRGVARTHNAFDEACKYFDEWMGPGKRDQFDTWVVDSGTSLIKASSNKGVVLLGERSKPLGITSGTHAAGVMHGVIYPKQQDYGVERSMTEQFVRMVKDSGKHFVFICHERIDMDDDGTITAIAPRLTGGSVEAVGAMFHEIWNIQAIGAPPNMIRQAITEPIGKRVAGSRTGIPSGTPFEWPAIKEAYDKIIASQAAMQPKP